MVSANSVTVAVSTGANDFQIVIAASHTSRDRQCATMQSMHTVSVHVTRQIRGTANAADHADLMRLQPELEQSRLKRGQHGKIAAAGAPIGMDPPAISLFGQSAGLGGG